MRSDATALLREAIKDQRAIASAIPALDEILLFALERKYLEIGEFTDLKFEQWEELQQESLPDRLRERVRFFKIDEVCYDRESRSSLSGVETVLSSLRESGHSLIFLVQGDSDGASVYLGLSQFDDDASMSVHEAIRVYESVWRANFPGCRFQDAGDDEIRKLSADIGRSTHCGFLTGLPSLKREEKSNSDFVQGLERLIRALRGETYVWMSVADPISSAQIEEGIEACHRLTSDIHHHVKTNLSKGMSKSKMVMAGMFGMGGSGTTDGTSDSVTDSVSETHTEGSSQQHLETHDRVAKAGPLAGAAAGAVIGSIVPGVGTAIGAIIGGVSGTVLSPVISNLGAAITGKAGHATTTSDSVTNTQAFTNTVSEAVSRQIAGGGFGSLGVTWTRTSSVTQEILNRKAEYCEELLRLHEGRLMTGRATGMWTVGHYFCAEDPNTYQHGLGVLRSIFSGMDSQYEPPRITGLPPDATSLLRRFANLYLSFPDEELRDRFSDAPIADRFVVAAHPFGTSFNGVGTPLTTAELAIATPLPTEDAEGIGVTERVSFGLNTPDVPPESSILIGRVLDRGEMTKQKFRVHLANLPKHLGVFGLTGSGKTTTVQSVLVRLWEKHRIPFFVIEPAKSEYRDLRRAESLRDSLAVITAGVETEKGCPLRLNPFAFSPVNLSGEGGTHLLTHIDRLRAIFNASFPMYASMPYLLEEALLEIYRDKGWDLVTSRNRYVQESDSDLSDYFPTLRDLHLKIDSVVQGKGYWEEQEKNLSAALKTRIGSLMTGAKGAMLNCRKSFSDEELFQKPVVVELKNLGDDDEKVFLMGLLVLRLYEYRDRQGAASGDLKHFLVIEEAHRLLANVSGGASGMESADMKGKGVSSFVDMLSEIRSYGQGVAIVDQVPGRLHPYIVKGTGTKLVHRLLAKDDREMVGETMGLNEGQMTDLGLLECGECIAHQDGDRKSFQCKVTSVIPSEKVEGDWPNEGTQQFRAANGKAIVAEQIHHSASNLDPNFAIRIHDEMMKVMAACAFVESSDSEMALDSLIKSSPGLDGAKGVVLPTLLAFWNQLSDEIWSFSSGEYGEFLSLREAGIRVLSVWAAGEDLEAAGAAYRRASRGYFESELNLEDIDLVAVVYDQLIVRFEILVAIAHRVSTDPMKSQSPSEKVIGSAIAKEVCRLLPMGQFKPGRELARGLVRALVHRVAKRENQRCNLIEIAIGEFWEERND